MTNSNDEALSIKNKIPKKLEPQFSHRVAVATSVHEKCRAWIDDLANDTGNSRGLVVRVILEDAYERENSVLTKTKDGEL